MRIAALAVAGVSKAFPKAKVRASGSLNSLQCLFQLELHISSQGSSLALVFPPKWYRS